MEVNHTEPKEPLSSNQLCQTINHCVSYEECCQIKKIMKLCEMLNCSSPLMKNNTKVVVFSTWTRFLDL
jgi:hypothetical protein